MDFEHQKIEKRWRKKWQEEAVYQPDLKRAEHPFYNLMMFPYPSAEGLHVGNMYAFTGADVFGRFQRMQGKEVLEPIGLDGFGIHSENYALKVGRHPAKQAKISEKRFYLQLSRIGNGFSWDNRLETYDPAYYRWTQWIFLQMFKRGLAYKKPSRVNWCPSCKTVLADEQVEAGVCERCKTQTEKRETEQWFFKITEYAQRLLDNIEKIDWPEKIKTAQRQWIGRKEGINISYQVQDGRSRKKVEVTCFTTRPDTNFGATFVVLGPEHPLLKLKAKLGLADKVWERVKLYQKKSGEKTEIERLAEGRKKTGVFLGKYCINELNGSKMPLYVSDFVLGQVGTGAVVGVPGHDKRDFEFAREFKLPVIRVVVAADGDRSEIKSVRQVQESGGVMVNSQFLDGMDIHQATQKIMDFLEKKGMGKRVIEYKLRDWCISRQRYWGAPIPMTFCKQCGWQPVAEEELPVLLPKVTDYKPKGDGTSPLENAPSSWLNTRCSKCKGKAKRETDVSDTFLDSSWYFLAYPNLGTEEWQGSESPFNQAIISKWLPVNAYIGGAEHAVLHLLYSRFVTMALKDWGYLRFEEPFPFLFSHGLIIKDGAKMSKSRGNVVVPDADLAKYGADTFRTYLMFLGPYEQGGDFRDAGVAGMQRFLKRVFTLFAEQVLPRAASKEKLVVKGSEDLHFALEETVRKVTGDIKRFKYNTAIAFLMEFVNDWEREIKEKKADLGVEEAKKFLQLLAPFAPFLSEELWQEIRKRQASPGGPKSFSSIHKSLWPRCPVQKRVKREVEVVVQVNGKLRGKFKIKNEDVQQKDLLIKKAREEPTVIRYLANKKVKNTIFVPGKLVNFVLS